MPITINDMEQRTLMEQLKLINSYSNIDTVGLHTNTIIRTNIEVLFYGEWCRLYRDVHHTYCHYNNTMYTESRYFIDYHSEHIDTHYIDHCSGEQKLVYFREE